jgi:putative transposase
MLIEMSITEMKQIIKEIQKRPEIIFTMLREEVREKVGEYLSGLMREELTQYLGRERYERKGVEVNYRNGSYARQYTLKEIGEVRVDIPRDRKGEYKTEVIPRSKRYEEEIRHEVCMLFLTGISTRTLSMISKKLVGRKISPQEVSNSTKKLIEAVEKWRTRDLSDEKIKYLFIDGVNFRMRVGRRVEIVPVLVVVGVNEKGQKMVLGFQSGDKESATSWREFFKDLKMRGLDKESVTLGIMDGLPGLEKVFEEEFPRAKVQRCQVHVARNVLAKVPKKLKQEVADDLRTIFYAPSEYKSHELFAAFKTKWENAVPSATKCLENSIDSCLTFFNYPENEWISLRTTNIIERLNKEFKRRTRPMEILAGELACNTLLGFICLKMELHWRTQKVGKVRKNLPFFKDFDIDFNFTQKT